jgi:hypothetical protein
LVLGKGIISEKGLLSTFLAKISLFGPFSPFSDRQDIIYWIHFTSHMIQLQIKGDKK